MIRHEQETTVFLARAAAGECHLPESLLHGDGSLAFQHQYWIVEVALSEEPQALLP